LSSVTSKKKNKNEKEAKRKIKNWCTLTCHRCTSYLLEECFL
jgi:hypothetical protein